MPRTKKQSTEAAVREIRRRTRRKFAPGEALPGLLPAITAPAPLSYTLVLQAGSYPARGFTSTSST
jgi:hypothetical protein